MKKRRLPSERAYAWECDFGLCAWAAPTKKQLVECPSKPSPEAKPVLVRLVKESELRRLVQAADAAGERVMARIDEIRRELLQAVVDVVDKLDDSGIPLRVPDPPVLVQRIVGLPMGRLHQKDEKALHAVANEIERLQAIVAKLPTCWRLVGGKLVRDVPVGPGMTLFCLHPDGSVHSVLIGYDLDAAWVNYAADGDRIRQGISDCYSTRAAAEAAREGEA